MGSLVGRSREVAHLDRAIASAAPGCRLVLVSGEAGIGKTRLVREATTRARDVLVLEGRADLLAADVAYAPLVEAFGRCLRAVSERQRKALVGGLPDLGRLFVGLRLPAPAAADPALEKTRLFEALALLIERLAADGTLVLVVDDLHWADRATLECLQFLIRRLDDKHVVVLATCRSDPAEATEGFTALIQSLRRLGKLDELELERLPDTDAEAIAGGLLQGEAPAALAPVIARAGGVPLFVELLVRGLVDAGRLVIGPIGWVLAGTAELELPAAIRDVLAARLARLSDDERRVIDCLAVDGAPLAHTVLERVSALASTRLDAALDSLRRSALIVEHDVRGPSYRAGHPLVLEVAYAALGAAVRARLHRAFVAALEIASRDPSGRIPLPSGGELARLSRHYRGAGDAFERAGAATLAVGAGNSVDRDRAIEVMLAAGDDALSIGAGEEAAAHFAGAVAQLRAAPRDDRCAQQPAPSGTPTLPNVLERLGEAWQRAGKGLAALAVWREARELLIVHSNEARGSAEPRTELPIARLHRRLGSGEFDRGDLAAARAEYSAALELHADRPSTELALLHRARGQLFDRSGDLDGLAAVVDDLDRLVGHSALDASRAPAPLRVAASLARARLHLGRDEYDAAIGALATALVAAAGNDTLLLQAHEVGMTLAVERGELAAVREHAAATLELALKLGAPASQIRAYGYTATSQLLDGSWDAAEKTLHTIQTVSRRYGIPRGWTRGRGMQGLLAILRGDLDTARAALDEARTMQGELADDYFLDNSLAMGETWLALEREDDLDRERVDRLVARLDGPGDLRAFRTLARVELLGAARRPDEAASIAQSIEQLASAPGPGSAFVAVAERAAAAVHAARDQRDGECAARVRAASAFRDAGMPFEAAREQLRGAADAATAQETLASFEQLGAQRWADRARKRLRELGVRPPPVRRATPSGGPLSKRELEVAVLFGQGLTTADVAKRLVISPHTAATHLQRIYQRLNVNSRAALTRYLVENGHL